MGFIISCLILLLAAAVGMEAVNLQVMSPSVTYWHEKLPMTAIPDTLMELISADDDKKVGVNVGIKGRVNEGVQKRPRKAGAPNVAVLQRNYGAAADAKMLADPSMLMYLLEKDLHAGTTMSLQLAESVSEKSHFLPRSVANKIPFSSGKISIALKQLNIEQGSDTAFAMKETLKLCEVPPIEGESKYCATSLESMIDYTTSKLGTNHVSVLITNVPLKTSKAPMRQQYTITDLSYQSKSEANAVVCHRQRYAYAVYYCHELKDTRTAQVSVKGEDGSSAEAVAVCHEDTSAWNPKHGALQVLNVKPGGAAVCHIIPQEVLVWLSAN